MFKEEPLADVKRVVIHRRRLYNFIAIAIGLIVFIILLLTLGKRKQDAIIKKDTSDDDKGTLYNTKKNNSDVSIPKFTCSSTVTSCPMYSNSTWTKLSGDIIGEAQNDYAGFATALSCDGSILAVSSIHDNNRTGHVRMYRWENDEQIWMKMGKDIEGTSPNEEFGYSLTMTSDGYTIAIGSPKSSDNAVRVFTYFDQSWVPLGQAIQAEVDDDLFGQSISFSIDGTRIAIGASSNDGTASDAGHARVFEISELNGESSWVQLGEDLDGGNLGDQFGRSVSLSGDGRRVAVSGHMIDTTEGVLNTGQVRVFAYESITKKWIQVATSINGQNENEYFGIAVSLSFDGRRLAVGSPDSEPYPLGLTRVYELTEVGWSQLGSNLFGGGNSIDLTLDGNRVAIGSKGKSGHLSVYDYDVTTSSWSQIGGDISGNEGDNSATSVAISADGKRVVSSSPSGSINGSVNSGIVRVYDFC